MPLPVEAVEPITVGLVKSPVILLISAVNVLPAENSKPVDVKGTEMVQPGISDVGLIIPTRIY